MRAARTLTLDSTVIVDLPDPVCGQGEVICRIIASATCGSDVHGWYVTRDEVLVRVEAATTCGTDVKMWRSGHPILPPYPARFGHETAGARGHR